MGSFLGGFLARRNEVVLVGRAEHVDAIRRRGLRITGKTRRVVRLEAYTKVPRAATPDLVLVATKAHDTPTAMTHLRPLASSALFLTLQNGLDNPRIIARTARRVAAGTTAQGVTLLGPGQIRHAGVGTTVIGRWSNVTEKDLVRLRDLFENAGIPAELTSDVRTELWAKVIVNASINPIAALAGVPNGRLVRDRRLLALLEAVCTEAAAVARAEGASIDASEIRSRTVRVARRTGANRASMLQDFDRSRRTEIEAITGAVVRAADRHRLPVPLNRALYGLIKARESARSRSREPIEPF